MQAHFDGYESSQGQSLAASTTRANSILRGRKNIEFQRRKVSRIDDSHQGYGITIMGFMFADYDEEGYCSEAKGLNGSILFERGLFGRGLLFGTEASLGWALFGKWLWRQSIERSIGDDTRDPKEFTLSSAPEAAFHCLELFRQLQLEHDTSLRGSSDLPEALCGRVRPPATSVTNYAGQWMSCRSVARCVEFSGLAERS